MYHILVTDGRETGRARERTEEGLVKCLTSGFAKFVPTMAAGGTGAPCR